MVWILMVLYAVLTAAVIRSKSWVMFPWFTSWCIAVTLNTAIWDGSLTSRDYFAVGILLFLRTMATVEVFGHASEFMADSERRALLLMAGLVALPAAAAIWLLPHDANWIYRLSRHTVEVFLAVFSIASWLYIWHNHEHLDIDWKLAAHGTLLTLYGVSLAGADFLMPRVFSWFEMSWDQARLNTVPITCAVVLAWLVVFARQQAKTTQR
jgi:hypothetical protein